MTAHPRILVATGLVLFVLLASTAHAQFGIGAGIAALGENLTDAGVNAATVYTDDSLTYGDVGGVLGVYGMIQFRGHGVFRLVGDAGYVYFPNERIEFLGGSASNETATFDVASSVIPLAFGADMCLPTPLISPYIGAQLTFTIFTRTLTFVNGDPRINTPELRNHWEGENEIGLGIRGGASFILGPLTLDAGLRFNISDLFTRESGAGKMQYLQAGLTVLFGAPMDKEQPDVVTVERDADQK